MENITNISGKTFGELTPLQDVKDTALLVVDNGNKECNTISVGNLLNKISIEQPDIKKSGPSRNIGDIFYTSRRENPLNGSYECDGTEFSSTDFEGENSPYNLLVENKISAISYDEYNSYISQNGVCGFFAIDTVNKKFKIPTLKSIFIEAGSANDVGTFTAAGLPNIMGDGLFWEQSLDTVPQLTGPFYVDSSKKNNKGCSSTDHDNYTVAMDLSRANPIYGNSDTVQPNSVKYRPMVQLASEVGPESSVQKYVKEIEDAGQTQLNEINTKGVEYVSDAKKYSEASKGLYMGQVFYSQSSKAEDNPGSLPLFTGETITGFNSIYPDFYNWIIADEGRYCTLREYETILNTYGECPKYGLGTTEQAVVVQAPEVGDVIEVPNGTVRLPLLKNYIKAANTTDGITQAEAGLPNITGSFKTATYHDAKEIATEAFSFEGTDGTGNSPNGNNKACNKITLDASRSSAIYGKSDTVTPAHTTLYPWVYAFNKAVEASLAQAAQFQQALSGKADVINKWSPDTFVQMRHIMTDLDWANAYVPPEITGGDTGYTITALQDGALFGVLSWSTPVSVNGIQIIGPAASTYYSPSGSPIMLEKGDVVTGHMAPTTTKFVPFKTQSGNNILALGLNYFGKYDTLEALNTASASIISTTAGQGRWALVGTDATGYTRYYTKPANNEFSAFEWAEGGKDTYVGPDADYVVEKYADANGNWWKLYKSGWLEQGGRIVSDGGTVWRYHTFPKPFSKNNYTITISDNQLVDGGAGSGDSIINLANSSPTQFCWYWNASSSFGISWYACGQGA